MRKDNNSYKKLAFNTVIFAIGSFSSKLLVLFLLPLYTGVLSPKQLGRADLIAQIANALLPIFTLSIAEAVIRFGLDREYDRRKVFSISFFITSVGALFLLILMPFIKEIGYVSGYGTMLYLYVVVASFKLLFSEMVRASGLVKLYAFSGIITAILMVIFNIILLLGFKMSINGYLLAIILSDVFSTLFIVVIARLDRYISLNAFDKKLAKMLLVYSIPMIPTTLLWLVTSVSDRFIVEHYIGETATGILSVSYRIPMIITALYGMFSRAWNMSAITEDKSSSKERFYSSVFSSTQSFLYIISAGLIMMIIPITKVLLSENYFASYKYAHILITSTLFTCSTCFLGTIYIVHKKTVRSFVTSMVAAVLNLILNFILIPTYGIYGAVIATLISYLVAFIVRLIDTRQFIQFKLSITRIVVNTAVLLGMSLSLIIMGDVVWVFIPLVLGFLLVLIMNIVPVLRSVKSILPEKLANKIPF